MDARKIMKSYILILIFGVSKSLGLEEVGDEIDALSNEIEVTNSTCQGDDSGATNNTCSDDDSGTTTIICPGIVALKNLSVKDFYNGKRWFEIEKNPKNAGRSSDCAKIRLSLVSGSPDVNFHFIYENDLDFTTWSGIVNDDSEIPYVTVTFPPDDTESLFYILNTDYENYALAYSCSSDFTNNKQDRIWILSKTEQPENYTLIQEAIEEQSKEFQEKVSKAEGCEEMHVGVVFCRNLTNKDQLNLEKFADEVWFEQLRSYNDLEMDAMCANVSFDYDTEKLNMKIAYETPNETLLLAFKVSNANNEINFVSSSKDHLYYYITDTDYDNYAVIYSCTQFSKTVISERLSLLGQYEKIEDEVIKKVNEEFSDLLQTNLSCPVPKAPPTTTTTTTIKITTLPTNDETTNPEPITTTEKENNSTKPEDRPPAYTFPGHEYKYYYMFQLEAHNKTKQ